MRVLSLYFFFNDTATTEIYTLSLHDALPISVAANDSHRNDRSVSMDPQSHVSRHGAYLCRPCDRLRRRSEEHTSELQSQSNLVCRLLLEKKKKLTYLGYSY